jgi:phosphoenolpyruvate carboxykinase (ATP)
LLLLLQCRMKVRVITSLPHHALFATNMLIRPTQQQLADFGEPDFLLYNAGAAPAPASASNKQVNACL